MARRVRLVCDAYGWDDTDTIVDEIRADLLRALANHERARRPKAAGIFRGMVRWIDAHGEAPSRGSPGAGGERHERARKARPRTFQTVSV